jgi:hypothetical protein
MPKKGSRIQVLSENKKTALVHLEFSNVSALVYSHREHILSRENTVYHDRDRADHPEILQSQCPDFVFQSDCPGFFGITVTSE